MNALYLYDDARARTFEPFASTRPLSEMISGAALIRERWKSALQPSETHFISSAVHDNFDEGTESTPATGEIPAGAVIANARCVPAIPDDIPNVARRAATCSMWRRGERLAAIRIKDPIPVSALADGTLALDTIACGTGAIGNLGGWWLDNVWDLIRLLPEQLMVDIGAFAAQPYAPRASVPSHVTVIGKHRVVLIGDVEIEPHVVLDVTAGPILINEGSHIRSFARINGPCYIGRQVQVLGGELTGCAIGDVCKVRGELSNTIFLGYSNKGHDGFVGHSYLGRWVNLGAGTITSNLKNTYGTVSMWTPDGLQDTGMQFLGTMFGDHVKTGIGLTLTTGTVLGVGANVFENMPPKTVPPFAWGSNVPYSVYRTDKFLESAARMMNRRHVEMSDRTRRQLQAIHEQRWTIDEEMTSA